MRPQTKAEEAGVITTESGLMYKVLKSGPAGGQSPDLATPCSCHYTGTLVDGTVFDSTANRWGPSTFAPNEVSAVVLEL